MLFPMGLRRTRRTIPRCNRRNYVRCPKTNRCFPAYTKVRQIRYFPRVIAYLMGIDLSFEFKRVPVLVASGWSHSETKGSLYVGNARAPLWRTDNTSTGVGKISSMEDQGATNLTLKGLAGQERVLSLTTSLLVQRVVCPWANDPQRSPRTTL